MEVLGLLLVYQVGWGGYAKFLEWISAMFIGGLEVLGEVGGLTGPARRAGVGFVAVGKWAIWSVRPRSGLRLRLRSGLRLRLRSGLRLRLRSGLRQSGRRMAWWVMARLKSCP